MKESVYRKKIQEVQDVYSLKFSDKTVLAWSKLFHDATDEEFEAGVNHMYRTAQTPAPRWIFEGIDMHREATGDQWI